MPGNVLEKAVRAVRLVMVLPARSFHRVQRLLQRIWWDVSNMNNSIRVPRKERSVVPNFSDEVLPCFSQDVRPTIHMLACLLVCVFLLQSVRSTKLSRHLWRQLAMRNLDHFLKNSGFTMGLEQ